jgi:hypothetical protein
MAKLNSGRVIRTPQTGITSDRYQFLGLEQAEPNLGDPLVGPSSIGANPIPVGTPYQLIAVGGQDGERYWGQGVGIGTTLGYISVYDNGFLPGNRFNAIHGINFVGGGVTVSTPAIDGPTAGVGIATVTIAVDEILNQGAVGEIITNSPTGFATGNSNIVWDYGDDNLDIQGTVTAPYFYGNLVGIATTALNLADAANITTGYISTERLDPNNTPGFYQISVRDAEFAPKTSIAETATNVIGGIGSITNLVVSGISSIIGIGSTVGFILEGYLSNDSEDIAAGTFGSIGTTGDVLMSTFDPVSRTGYGITWVSVEDAALFGRQGIQGVQGTQGPQGLQGIQGRVGFQGIQGTQGVQGTQGLQGISGGIGGQGVQGIQGNQGIQGVQGTQGIQGVQGTRGLQGLTGPQGVQGLQGISGGIGGIGPQGIQGIQGTQGVQGIQGVQGTQGLQGISGGAGGIGPQGIQGIQGIQGNQGIQGIQGTQGVQGIQGVQGTQGLQGISGGTGGIGLQGIQGIQGNQGIQGVQGVQGNQGIQGVQGVQGNQGIQGVQGTQGLQGISGGTGGIGPQGVQGFQGVQGVQGNQGIQGIQGVQGVQGRQGVQGVQGNQGVQGVQGNQGVQGVQGRQGIQGVQGIQGLTGAGSQGVQGFQGVQGVQGNQGIQGIQGTQGLFGPATIPQSAVTTITSADNGKHVFSSSNVTIDGATGGFTVGQNVVIVNGSGTSINITLNSGTLRFAGTNLTDNTRTLVRYGVATILCTANSPSTTFYISGSGLV